MSHWFLLFVLAVTAPALAQPCEGPRLHDPAPLAAAQAQDQLVAQSFARAAQVCIAPGDACDRARLECGAVLAAVAQKQKGFDEGVWLRDLLLPYLGQQYPAARVFTAAAQALDGSCNVSTTVLGEAAQRRTAQAARRGQLLEEYSAFTKWSDAMWQKCREHLTAEEQRATLARAEAERLALAAAAEATKKKAEDEARLKAEADAKAARDAELARAAQAQEAQRRQAAAEESARHEQENLAARAQAEREFERTRAQDQARAAEETRQLNERERKTVEARRQRDTLIGDAEFAYKRAVEAEAAKKQAALDAVSDNPTVAQAAVAEAAQATTARIEAEKRLSEARLKAERIEIDDSWERSRGHIAILGGGGVVGFGGEPVQGAGGVLATAHFGFWGQPPLTGLAWGFEVGLGVQYLQPVGPAAGLREFSGHATARYFFGPLAVGATGEFRIIDPQAGARAFGVGPSLGVALLDTPHSRIVLSASWMPVGTAIDLTRTVGDLEFSWQWFSAGVGAGLFTSTATSTVMSWSAHAHLGVRLGW